MNATISLSRRTAITAIPAALSAPPVNAAKALTHQELDARIAHQIEILKTLAKARYPQIEDWRITSSESRGCALLIAAFTGGQ